MRLHYTLEFSFNYPMYWKARLYIQKSEGVTSKLLLLWIRRVESKKCTTTGTGIGKDCCCIKSPIITPHGLIGIVIARNVVIGSNVTIFQHATIAESDKSKTTIIEDDVVIGTGAVILNNVRIGKGAKIGANAVVLDDIPPYATAVGVPARIILKY